MALELLGVDAAKEPIAGLVESCSAGGRVDFDEFLGLVKPPTMPSIDEETTPDTTRAVTSASWGPEPGPAPVEEGVPPDGSGHGSPKPACESDWADMSAAEQQAAATLGWDEASWTAGDDGPLANQWHLLTHSEQAAGLRMGYGAGDFGPD